MNRNLPVCFAVALLIAASLAWAQPVGPNTTIPGFSLPESQVLNGKAMRLLERFQAARGGPPLTPGTRSFICAVAGFTAALIVGEMTQMGAQLRPQDARDGRKALVFLNEVMNRFCDRPKGGDVGTGNDGDQLLGFAAKNGATARVLELRRVLGDRLGLPEDSVARDVALAVAVVLAGAATLPSLALP